MANIKLTIAIMLKSLLILCLYGFSINVYAETASDTTATAEPERKKLVISRKDKQCAKCHKESYSSLHESHGYNAVDILGKQVKCADCHNKISSKHRNGAPKVTKYFEAQSQPGTEKQVLTQSEILKANKECTDCHKPDDLREKFWTHDVHAKNLTCTNCHNVHASKAKVLSFDHKQRVQLCVDCHSDFTKMKKAKQNKEDNE
ncbi:cytochrome c nitrite reductase pentaheme subunit [Vibrio sp. DW001]|uniref:cytochrome c nitrite reductase pentaheme subunit n=1 Tax=Vibrio sp. DW001 TaxID=2912315 RepID=UPI0023B04196|nr:cytochrome c nitrite reductase pentaheme subunit [Vibrio sp. DW001]WED28002.1 cytochrome c nitrite reductase pentaheme subunit [Vibrio sp. DW001]